MSAADSTTHAALLKRLYTDEDVVKLMYENNPLYAMTSKDYDGYGESWHMPMRIAHTMGRSRTFANAKANKKGSLNVKMLITVAKDYSLYSVDGLLAKQTSNNKGAFVEAFEWELEGAMDAMNRSCGISVYRNGGGAVGRLTSTATLTGTQFSLTNPDDIVNFEVGDVCGFSATDGTSGSVRSGTAVIASIVRDPGSESITFQAALNSTVPLVAASDYIFHDGDFGAAIKGVAAWLPTTAPTGGDNFFGLDRSTDPTRLAGVRVDGTGLTIEEAIQKLLQVTYRNGGKVDKIFLNDAKFLELDLSLGTRRQYVDVKTDVGVGFTGVRVSGPAGPCAIFSDPNCPLAYAYGLESKDWHLRGPGKFPFIDATDGNRILREDSADAYEGRVIAYYQMQCKAPGHSGVLTLP